MGIGCTINKKKYSIPISCSEIKLSDFLNYERTGTPLSLSGIPEDVILFLDEDSKTKIENILTIAMSGNTPEDTSNYYTLEGMPIGAYLDWKNIIEKKNNAEILIYNLCFFDKKNKSFEDRRNSFLENSEKSLSLALSLHNNISEQFETIQKKFAPLFEDPSAQEVDAGVETLNNFGGYSILYNLSGGNILNIDSVSGLSVGECFFFLCYQKADAMFRKNYEKIILSKNGGV